MDYVLVEYVLDDWHRVSRRNGGVHRVGDVDGVRAISGVDQWWAILRDSMDEIFDFLDDGKVLPCQWIVGNIRQRTALGVLGASVIFGDWIDQLINDDRAAAAIDFETLRPGRLGD